MSGSRSTIYIKLIEVHWWWLNGSWGSERRISWAKVDTIDVGRFSSRGLLTQNDPHFPHPIIYTNESGIYMGLTTVTSLSIYFSPYFFMYINFLFFSFSTSLLSCLTLDKTCWIDIFVRNAYAWLTIARSRHWQEYTKYKLQDHSNSFLSLHCRRHLFTKTPKWGAT